MITQAILDPELERYRCLQRMRFDEGILCMTYEKSENGEPVPAKICGNCKWGFSNAGIHMYPKGFITSVYLCECKEENITVSGFIELDGHFFPKDDIKIPKLTNSNATCEHWELKSMPELVGSF